MARRSPRASNAAFVGRPRAIARAPPRGFLVSLYFLLGVERDALRLRSPPSPCPRPRILLARALRGQARACQGMPRAFMDRTRIRAEDAGVAAQDSKRPRLMRLGTPYAPRPPNFLQVLLISLGAACRSLDLLAMVFSPGLRV